MPKYTEKELNKLFGIEAETSHFNITPTDLTNTASKESILAMVKNIGRYKTMLSQKLTFINPVLSAHIPFTLENLYLICAFSGSGKCFKIDTPVLMYDGSIKMVQDVMVGDKVMGADSTPRTVMSLGRGQDTMYDVVPTKGDTYTVNSEHILSLRLIPKRKIFKELEQGSIINMPIKKFISLRSMKSVYCGYRVGVEYSKQDIEIDPYFVGYWLGDGSSRGTGITTMDKEVVDYLYNFTAKISETAKNPLSVRVNAKKNNKASTYTITITNIGSGIGSNSLLSSLQNYNLINNKHIPKEYLINSRKNRLKLLAGIIDSDGSYDSNGCVDMIFKNQKLANDIVYLCRSLGFAAYIKKCNKTCCNNGKIGEYYRITLSGDLSLIPTIISRKKMKPRRQIKNVLNVGIKVIEKGIDNYYGFTVDGDHRFLLGDFTVVHNSSCAANITYPLWQEGKRVLVISNEESKQDVYLRIACLHLGHDFNSYKKGNLPLTELLEAVKLFEDISKYVHVFDIGEKDGASSKLEGIKEILEAAKDENYSCILIDYWQNIRASIESPDKGKFAVLDELRSYFMEYIKVNPIPLVVFAQLHSIGKRQNKDLDSRIKDAPTIYEAATVVLEMVADFKKRVTHFAIKKDRFGLQGFKITLGYDRGRFVEITDDFTKSVNDKEIDRLTGDENDSNYSKYLQRSDDIEDEQLKEARGKK